MAAVSLDCEKSLFFLRFSESNARARSGEAARRTKRGRQPEKKKERLPAFSCLSRLARSVTRVAIYVSRVLLDGLQKKERLPVVYRFIALEYQYESRDVM